MFKLFQKKPKEKGFYKIIKDSSSREKKKIVKEAVRSANKEQRAVVSKYYKLPLNTTKGKCA